MLAVIDQRLPLPCRNTLSSLGFSLVALPPFPRLPLPVSSHPDMLLFRMGDKLFCHKDYTPIAERQIETILSQTDLELIQTDDAISDIYPHDVSLNLVFAGNALIGKTNAMAQKVKQYAAECNIPVYSVNQGYTKCSSVVLESGLITSDSGIAKAAPNVGLDCLLVSPGHVTLKGYDYGFIGGASGVYQKTVFFCGNIKKHKDGKSMESFCRLHSYDVISLSDEPLFDAGTIMFF